MRSMHALIATAVLVVGAWSATARAGDDAGELIRRANAGRAAGNSIQTIELTMTTSNGATKQYLLETLTRDSGEVRGSRATIREPAELAGTTLLSVEGPDGARETYLYMPAGGSLMRIEGSGRKGPFMGTDFSYEDLELGDADAGTHTLLGDESITVAGTSYDCHRIETVPNAGLDTAYGKLITWIQKDGAVPRQITMYAPDGSTAIKRMTIEEVAGDGSTMPTRVRMDNLGRGSSTLMVVRSHRGDVPESELPAELFDPEQLQTRGERSP